MENTQEEKVMLGKKWQALEAAALTACKRNSPRSCSSGYCNKITANWAAYKQQKVISHSAGRL